MNDNKKYTDEQQKSINKSSMLISCFLIFYNVYVILNYSIRAKIGTGILYILLISLVVAFIIGVVYIYSFFSEFKKLKEIRYIISLISMIIMTLSIGYLSTFYILDFIHGTDIVITNEYRIRSAFSKNIDIIIDNNDNEISIYISKELAEYLSNENNVIKDATSNNILQYHEKDISIEYYPNTEILKSIEILNK